ncbi:MAG: NADP-specific glutamate dehydrogenase [Cyclobacteriaceae bacterium]
MSPETYVSNFMEGLHRRNPGQPEFHQAVLEFVGSIAPFLLDNQHYLDHNIMERLTEPDRVMSFRVAWQDDKAGIQVNRGYRIQFNNAIGPYKGGLRFHPTVNEGVLKFLAFEQIFKNSLTTLPMGGGKGGANFNPKGKSDGEVMRFCQAFMTELSKYIGPNTDVPAGDIGVGGREIGYLFGQYKRLQNEFTGILTGKPIPFGGSLIRTEATGYGCVYFVENMLNHKGNSVKGKTCVVSGSGNVAQYTVEKILHLGGKVVTLSDSGGFIHDPDGIDQEKLDWVKELKGVKRGRISEYVEQYPSASYHADQRPWSVKCDVAFPSATQNEINGKDAQALLDNGCIAVGEGANMPSDLDAIHIYLKSKILYGPSKAANAGGVAVSGLEMTQNSMRLNWTSQEVEDKLKDIMQKIHSQCIHYGQESADYIDYVKGANIAGFVKVADATIAQGVV